MDDYVSHPLIKKNAIERRLYQENVLSTIVNNNTLLVLPTGLGKTVIAALLAAQRMNTKGGKVLFMAPTRPLVEQHRKRFDEFLEIDKQDMKLFTGKKPPAEREKEYSKSVCIFATPQVIQNDIIAGRLQLSDLSLVIFDEAHKGVKDYPYPFIADMYMRKSENPRILALTASPGSTKDKIDEVRRNMFLDAVEVKSDEDEDVKIYTHPIKSGWKFIDLPKEFRENLKILREVYKQRLKKLKNMEIIDNINLRKKDLLQLSGKLRSKLGYENVSPHIYIGISVVAEALKVEHALALMETQGSKALLEYMKRLKKQADSGKNKAVKRLMNDHRMKAALIKTHELVGENIEHPKLDELYNIVEKQFESQEDSKVIVFCNYRDSIEKVNEIFQELKGCKPVKFIGQKGGLSQKKQVRILKDFEEGKYNTLLATAIGEEGLDIPNVDLVIFYEPVPSEIRAVQRRGRTGRKKAGKVITLVTKDTRDEGIYWSTKHKEKKMKNILKNMKREDKQKSVKEFG